MKTPIGAATAALALVTAGAAAASELTVTYESTISAIPTLSDWAVIALGLMLAAGAVVMIRHRGASRGIAYGVAGLVAVSTLGVAGYSRAANYDLFLAGTGSDSITVTNNTSHQVTVTNTTSSQVTLTDVSVSGPHTLFIGTECSPDVVLAPNATCNVSLLINPPRP